jgi:hypothetical protein
MYNVYTSVFTLEVQNRGNKMLKYDELISELKNRSLDEKRSILEFLNQSITEEARSGQPQRKTPAEKLLGIAKPAGPIPNDDELEEMRFNDLLQKYS